MRLYLKNVRKFKSLVAREGNLLKFGDELNKNLVQNKRFLSNFSKFIIFLRKLILIELSKAKNAIFFDKIEIKTIIKYLIEI